MWLCGIELSCCFPGHAHHALPSELYRYVLLVSLIIQVPADILCAFALAVIINIPVVISNSE
jgi:hypothetical protein